LRDARQKIKPDDRGTLENKDQQLPPDNVNDADSAFSDAFDTATKEQEIPDTAVVDDKTPVPVEDADKKKPDADTAPAPDSPPDKKADPPLDKDKDGSYEQQYRTLQGIHKHDREIWNDEKSQLLAQIDELKKGGDKPTVTQDKKTIEEADKFLQEIRDSLTEEELAQLAEYKQEFDVVSKMEGLQRKVEMGKLRKDIMELVNGIKETIQSQLKPVQESVTQFAEDREESDKAAHFGSIKEKHADFETYRDNGSIKEWIAKQPVHLRPGLIEVYANGTSDQIISMLDQFKHDNNITPKLEDEPPDTQLPDNVVKIKETKKDAMRSPVSRKTAVNPTHTPAESFEDAFEEALKKQKGGQ